MYAIPSHQVLIIGGGLVGSALAIALDRAGIDTGLVEASAADSLPAVFDQRNLSFAETTTTALTTLDILPRLRHSGGLIRRVHISRRGEFGRAVLHASDYGREAFGQVVVARDFGLALEAALTARPAITRYRPARFVGFGQDSGIWREVRLAGGTGDKTVRAGLVVAADGSRSAVRTALGIGADAYDYRQRLIIARVHSTRGVDGTAWERLTDHGPTALVPRGDGYYGLIHAVDEAEADAVLALDDGDFLRRVQHIFGWRAGRLLETGPRSAHPARKLVAREVFAPRVALVGNAAQTLHPIGAQGFNLGLRDALLLAEQVATTSDPGDAALLQTWARQRRADRERTLAFSDGLARITANPFPPLGGLRSLGLLAIDCLPSVQAWLAGGAMGYRGEVPALCRNRA